MLMSALTRGAHLHLASTIWDCGGIPGEDSEGGGSDSEQKVCPGEQTSDQRGRFGRWVL